MTDHRPFFFFNRLVKWSLLEFVADMSARAWLGFAVLGTGLLLVGCGGGAPAVPPVNPLAGNWLIVGPMPTNGFSFSPVSGFRLAMTFDITGNNITAAGFANAPCALVSPPPPILGAALVSFGMGATGTITADGSFSLQTPATLPVASIAIQGKVPQANSGEWSGSYTASLNSSLGPPCTGSFMGPFTATSFPLVSGVYVGTGSSQTTVNGLQTPVTFQVTLQQGGTVVDRATGKPFTSNLVLVGGIRVQGSPCFTSGVTGSTPPSEVEGNQVVATFTMDDGSTLTIEGALADPTEARITTSVAIVTGGQCGKVPFVYQLRELDRQS